MRQVGYLQELYRDAGSAEHKKKLSTQILYSLSYPAVNPKAHIQGGSNMTGTDFFFLVTIIADHSSNSQTGLNRF